MDFLLNSLYSPFFYFYFGTLAAWGYLMLRVFRQCNRSHQRALILFGAGLVLVGGLATPLGNRILLHSLITENPLRSPQSEGVDFILVAASGYLIMGDSREDVLRDGTAQRVASAANLHAQFPDAVVVMQGTGYLASPAGSMVRPADSQGVLMKRLAVSMGVPAGKIRIEDQSRNSREHVEALAKLEGISRDSRLVVVSSDWHIRRLKMVFNPVFPNTSYFPSVTLCGTGFSPAQFWPSESTLTSSRTYLREWAGIIYYWLTS
jgi:uncharacterized SAM-binding protein YcdF (DUF218 family)